MDELAPDCGLWCSSVSLALIYSKIFENHPLFSQIFHEKSLTFRKIFCRV